MFCNAVHFGATGRNRSMRRKSRIRVLCRQKTWTYPRKSKHCLSLTVHKHTFLLRELIVGGIAIHFMTETLLNITMRVMGHHKKHAKTLLGKVKHLINTSKCLFLGRMGMMENNILIQEKTNRWKQTKTNEGKWKQMKAILTLFELWSKNSEIEHMK